MLKFLRSVDWKPTYPYLALIAILLGFALLVPHLGQSVQEVTDSKSNQTSAYDFLYSATFWEAFATCVIAGFAFMQIRDSRISSERQLRAYVALEDAALEGDIEFGKPIKIAIVLKNYGQTPAYRCAGSVNCIVWDFSDDGPMEYLPHDLDPEPFGVMHPGQVFAKTKISPNLTKEQAVGLLTGKKAVWLFGQFTYETAFGISRRTTNFRRYLAKIEGQNIMDRALGISEYGNDAD